MSTAREVAIELLPQFARNVLAGHVYSYGHYATAIGRDAATDSIVIGKAMHAIGGVCVLCAIPVAPLYFVERADDAWRGVFESDVQESIHVLPHYDVLYVTARDFKYSQGDFDRLTKGLRDVLPRHLRPDQLSPHDIWHVCIYSKLKDGSTPFTRALARYQSLFDAARSTRPTIKK